MTISFSVTSALAVLAAFVVGIVLVIGIALALDGDESPRTAVVETPETSTLAPSPSPRPTATVAAQPTQAPSPIAAPTSAPTSVPAQPTTAPPPTVAPQPVATATTAAPSHVQGGAGYEVLGFVWSDDDIPVPYCVNPANPPINSAGDPLMSDVEFAAVVQNAFHTWENVSGSYIAFAYTGICSNDPFDTLDRVNTVGWGWLFSTAIGAAAPAATHGQFLRQSSAGQVVELDIVIDVRYAQSFDNEAEYINRALVWILLHEIGHLIGLDHTEEPCSIMQPVIVDAVPSLCVTDMNGARALYPE